MNSADDEVYDIATFFKSTAFSRICPLGEESFPWEGVAQRHCGRDPAQEPLLACQCPDTALPTVGLQGPHHRGLRLLAGWLAAYCGWLLIRSLARHPYDLYGDARSLAPCATDFCSPWTLEGKL